jgi:hypothetical protein
MPDLSSLNSPPSHDLDVPPTVTTTQTDSEKDEFNRKADQIWDSMEKEGKFDAPSLPVVEPKSEEPAADEKAATEPEPPKAEKPRKAKAEAKIPNVDDVIPRTDQPEKVEAKAEPAEPHDEIDALELPSSAPEVQRSQFSQLKQIAKNFATEAKTFKAKAALYEQAIREAGLEPSDEAALISAAQAIKNGRISPDAQVDWR